MTAQGSEAKKTTVESTRDDMSARDHCTGGPVGEASFWAPDLTEGARNRKNTWIDQAPRRTEVEERRYVRRSHHVVGVPALDEEARLPAGAAGG